MLVRVVKAEDVEEVAGMEESKVMEGSVGCARGCCDNGFTPFRNFLDPTQMKSKG